MKSIVDSTGPMDLTASPYLEHAASFQQGRRDGRVESSWLQTALNQKHTSPPASTVQLAEAVTWPQTHREEDWQIEVHHTDLH